MVDIHSHILPEVDDGPKSWDVSVAMCRAAAADGITHMVATPHANDRYHYDRDYLKGLLDHLQELTAIRPSSAWVAIFIFLSTICWTPWPIPRVTSLKAHATNWLSSATTVCRRRLRIPFSAGRPRDHGGHHASRAQPDFARESAARRGVGGTGLRDADHGLGLTGFWGERTRRAAVWLLEHQAVHVLATDAHDPEKRIPILSTSREAAAEICGEDMAEALVEGKSARDHYKPAAAVFSAACDDQLQEELARTTMQGSRRGRPLYTNYCGLIISDEERSQVTLRMALESDSYCGLGKVWLGSWLGAGSVFGGGCARALRSRLARRALWSWHFPDSADGPCLGPVPA